MGFGNNGSAYPFRIDSVLSKGSPSPQPSPKGRGRRLAWWSTKPESFLLGENGLSCSLSLWERVGRGTALKRLRPHRRCEKYSAAEVKPRRSFLIGAPIGLESLLLAVWFLLPASSAVSAATYVVAQRHPKASDSGPGTAEQPWKTLSAAAEHAAPGDQVLIQDGDYRETVVVKASGTKDAPIRFEAAPGAHVLISGADRLSGWKRIAGGPPVYQVHWPYRFNTWSKNMTHPDDEYHRLIGRCEQVICEGYLLRQVLESNQLAPGTFYADCPNQTLSAWDIGGRDLNGILVEASTRQELLRVTGEYVEWRGTTFRYAANAAQHGAVVLAGSHDALEDCVVERMNSSGAGFLAPDQAVRGCVFRDNGQIGFGANGAHDLLLTGCLVENNNVKGFDRGWEAGGDKLVLSRGAVLERSRFLRNRGSGIWFDIGNERCIVRQCLIADNEDSGIFDEISYGLLAQDNVIVGNGFAETRGAWGAQAGIVLSSSPESVVERNLILGNREGFDFREQLRTTPRIGDRHETPVWNHNEIVRYNLIACNRDAQIWGWFDLADDRHWSAEAGRPATAAQASTPQADFAAAYKASTASGQPQGLTLKDLDLRFEHNRYFAPSAQAWFHWGVTWRRHRSYSDLEDFQKELGVDTGSQVFEPTFADPAGLDFRFDTQTMARIRECYPQGAVPGVLLGVRP